jgi:hypothetical protein
MFKLLPSPTLSGRLGSVRYSESGDWFDPNPRSVPKRSSWGCHSSCGARMIAKALPRRGSDLNDHWLGSPSPCFNVCFDSMRATLLRLFHCLSCIGQLWVLGPLRSQHNDGYSLHNLCFVASTMSFCSIVNPSAPVLFYRWC